MAFAAYGSGSAPRARAEHCLRMLDAVGSLVPKSSVSQKRAPTVPFPSARSAPAVLEPNLVVRMRSTWGVTTALVLIAVGTFGGIAYAVHEGVLDDTPLVDQVVDSRRRRRRGAHRGGPSAAGGPRPARCADRTSGGEDRTAAPCAASTPSALRDPRECPAAAAPRGRSTPARVPARAHVASKVVARAPPRAACGAVPGTVDRASRFAIATRAERRNPL